MFIVAHLPSYGHLKKTAGKTKILFPEDFYSHALQRNELFRMDRQNQTGSLLNNADRLLKKHSKLCLRFLTCIHYFQTDGF